MPSISRIASASLLLALVLPNTTPAQETGANASSAKIQCKDCDTITPFKGTEGLGVTIIVKDSFATSNLDAIVRQLPGPSGSTMIGLRRAAITPELLYDALTAIASVRTKHQGPPPATATTYLRAVSKRRPVPTEDRAWIADIIAQLERAKRVKIDRVGIVPAINVTIDSTKAHKTKG